VTIINIMLNRLPEHLTTGTPSMTSTRITPYIHIMEASLEHTYDRDNSGVEYWVTYDGMVGAPLPDAEPDAAPPQDDGEDASDE